jgi:hypothetical protein
MLTATPAKERLASKFAAVQSRRMSIEAQKQAKLTQHQKHAEQVRQRKALIAVEQTNICV